MNYKKALGLGFELSSFFMASYVAHEAVAQALEWNKNNVLALLLGLSLALWTVHAFYYIESNEK